MDVLSDACFSPGYCWFSEQHEPFNCGPLSLPGMTPLTRGRMRSYSLPVKHFPSVQWTRPPRLSLLCLQWLCDPDKLKGQAVTVLR